MTTKIHDIDVTPKDGSYIITDESLALGGHCARLSDEVDGRSIADLRECGLDADLWMDLHSRGPISAVAVRVQVTGRTIQWVGESRRVRVKVTFVGDGEPDTETRGWLWV